MIKKERTRASRLVVEGVTALLAGTLLATAFGWRLELHLFGGRQTVGGWERPFLLLGGLLVFRAIATWLRPRSPLAFPFRPSGATAIRATERSRPFLLAAGVAVVALPLFFPRNRFGFEYGGVRGAGLALLVALAAAGALRLAGGSLREIRLDAKDLFLVIALPLYLLFTANGAELSSGDNSVTRRIGPWILQHGTLDMRGSPPVEPYALYRFGPRLLPTFPLGTGLLALPHSALALAVTRGEVTEPYVARLEKHFAALAMAAAAVLLFLAFRSFGEMEALAAAGIFGLATTVFTSAGQAMWSFTGEILLLCFSLFLLLPSRGAGRAAAAGCAMGAAFLCRPTALVAGGFLFFALAARRRRDAVVFAAAAALSVGAAAWWLFTLYGNPLGGYGVLNPAGRWSAGGLLMGLLGNLLSPSRGLLVHFPYLLFVPLAFVAVRNDRDLRPWWLAAFATTATVVVIASSYDKWWGGHSIGPRVLTETAPFLALLVLPILLRWRERGRGRILFAASLSFAVLTQIFSSYDERVHAWNEFIDDKRWRLWSVRDSQIVRAWTPRFLARPAPPGPPPREVELLGAVDAPAEGEVVNGALTIRGWARMPGDDLTVSFFLDGDPLPVASFRRVPRPDVCAVFPQVAPCDAAGYEAVVSPRFGDAEASHELVALFRTPDGRERHYPSRKFTWKP